MIRDRILLESAYNRVRLNIPSKLYHATFGIYETEILHHGLKICTEKRNFDWCEKGIYLASSAGLAESFVEVTELEDGDYPENDVIIIFEVNTLYLDPHMLEKDPHWNIEGQVGSEENLSYVYREDIPPEALKILNG